MVKLINGGELEALMSELDQLRQQLATYKVNYENLEASMADVITQLAEVNAAYDLETNHYISELSAAKEEIERLKTRLEHEEKFNARDGNFKPMQNEIRSLRKNLAASQAENKKLRDLLVRIRQWDMMDVAADGTFWRKEIDNALTTQSDNTTLKEICLKVANECKRVSCDMRVRRIDWDSVSLESIVDEVLGK